LLAGLLALAGVAVAAPPPLTPAPKRLTDARIAVDRAVFEKAHERVKNVNVQQVPLGAYHRMKAEAWIEFSHEEYDENDRTRIIEFAYAEGMKLVEALEAGKTDISLETPFPTKYANKVRADLWDLVAQVKKDGKVDRVARPLAILEIKLVEAGHEVWELGWRHARGCVAEAEQYALEIREGLAAPAVKLPPNFLLNPPADLVVEQAAPEGTRNVALGTATPAGFEPLTPTVTHNAPALFPPGATLVTWTAKDTLGHTATAVQQVIVVDTIAPALKPPADVTAPLVSEAGTSVALGTPEVSDAADPKPVVTHNAPATFPFGLTTVVWTAKDATGNTSRAVQRVRIVPADVKPPKKTLKLTPPADLTVVATGPAGTAVPLGKPTVVGDDPNPTIKHNGPALFPLGVTAVTWTATDVDGNTASGIQRITVVTKKIPKLLPPPDKTVEVTGILTPVGDIGKATASEFDDPNPAITNDGPAKYVFGPTMVTWTAKDTAGHVVTAKQKITIVDTTPPLLVPKPDIIIRVTKAGPITVDLGTPESSDNCGLPPTVTHDAPATYKFGTTTVTWRAEDPSHNKSAAVQKVTVISGFTPRFKAPPDIILRRLGNAGTPVTLGTPTHGGFADPTPTITNNGPKLYPLGKTIVTWTATDSAGNTLTALQVVIILETNLPAWVHFAYDSYEIKPNTEAILAKVAETLRKYPDISVTLIGHTDPRGSAEYNMRLGKNRATALLNYFVSKGVAANRFAIESVGKSRPVADGGGELIHAMNRTVELMYRSTRGEIKTDRQVDDLQLMR
jgi:outer membrane protein OmpA-like peptidoglycan-associated protein